MNSDNTSLAGRTIDYGPFGFVEQYSHSYQPFTSDPGKNFSLSNQPEAMHKNVTVLGATVFKPLIQYLFDEYHSQQRAQGHQTPLDKFSQLVEIENIASVEYWQEFNREYGDVCRRKLGFKLWNDETDKLLWTELLDLLER